MNSDLFFTDMREAIINEYFDICRYFLYTKDVSQGITDSQLSYYKDCILHRASAWAGEQVPTEYDARVFFSAMNCCAAIDVRMRTIPELLSFFRLMTPILTKALANSAKT